MVLLPQQGNPPWLWLAALDARILYPDARRVCRTSIIFVSVTTAKPTPICANPLAADVNPALRPQRMFHAASIKAPPPPGKGGADEVDIVIDNLVAKLINHLRNQQSN